MITAGMDFERALDGSLDHGYNATGAIFIPVRTGSLAILAGEHYLKSDAFNLTCPIGCKTCSINAPAGSPWRTNVNLGWKF
jgi:hypothetical protein